MFSSSTIESSTSRPTASASPPSVKTFSVCPRKYMQMNVQQDRERDRDRDDDASRCSDRRKIRMTRNASTAPWIASCQRLSIACRM